MKETSHMFIISVHDLRGVPFMRIVFLEMVVIHVVSVMTETPGPIGDHDRTVGQVTEQIVQPFVVRECTMAAIVTNDE